MNSIDTFLFRFFNDLAGKWIFLDSVVIVLSNALGILIVVSFFILLFQKKHRLQSFFNLTGGLLCASALVYAIKFFYSRPRPFSVLDISHQLLTNTGSAFP